MTLSHIFQILTLMLCTLVGGHASLNMKSWDLRRSLQDTATASSSASIVEEACRDFSSKGACSGHDMPLLDHALKSAGGVAGFYSNLKLHEAVDQSLTFEIPSSCYTAPAADFRVGLTTYNISLTPIAMPATVKCSLTPGVWFIASDLHHKQESLFEDLITTLYPLYLMTHVACLSNFKDVMITHVGGNRAGFLAHQDLYSVLGSYIPWPMVVNRGGTHSDPVAGCLQFDKVMIARSEFTWRDAAVPAHVDHHLQAFAHLVVSRLQLSEIQPERCKRHLLLSLHPWEAVNIGALVEALSTGLHGYTVEVTELSSMPFTQAVSLLRKADIFVFGSVSEVSPLLMFRPQGTVSVELIPLRRATAMARNLAVLTSHIYLFWQQIASGGAADQLQDTSHGMGPGSVMTLDVPPILDVVRAAAMVVLGNAGENFHAEAGVTPLPEKDCT